MSYIAILCVFFYYYKSALLENGMKWKWNAFISSTLADTPETLFHVWTLPRHKSPIECKFTLKRIQVWLRNGGLLAPNVACEPGCASAAVDQYEDASPSRPCSHASRYATASRTVHLEDLAGAPRRVAMTPPAAAEDDLVTAGSWLESHSGLVERWLRERASTELRQRVQQALVGAGPVAKRASVTSDLFQLWLAASPSKLDQQIQNARPMPDYETMEESELFMELIRDVANELDIDVLCHKILRNVSLLTHADRGSLFLARGQGECRYLVAKLFDVRRDTDLEEAIRQAKTGEIRIPFGVGIAGTVAQNKTLINIKDAYNVSK